MKGETSRPVCRAGLEPAQPFGSRFTGGLAHRCRADTFSLTPDPSPTRGRGEKVETAAGVEPAWTGFADRPPEPREHHRHSFQSPRQDSNLQSPAPEAGALPIAPLEDHSPHNP